MAYKDPNYRRNYYLRNREKAKQQSRDWYFANREEVLKRSAERNPIRNAIARKRKYGLTPEQIEAIVTSQCGRCLLCKKKPEDRGCKPRLIVDHCHASGKVRGMLCDKCNLVLGLVDDDPEVLARMINYLNGHLANAKRGRARLKETTMEASTSSSSDSSGSS